MKYPIGIQTFDEIRKGGYVYVDKTRYIHDLLNRGKYFFLSRPRRFGKSLLLSTIKAICNGNKVLFEGLWIKDQWDWETQYPVIHLKFSTVNYQNRSLTEGISMHLDDVAAEYGVKLEKQFPKEKFLELITGLNVRYQQQVVILIDEYDKPIIDYLDDMQKAEENRATLRGLYSVLKDSDPYIRFMLITGVSKFAKVSIFSDLNNLSDISLREEYNEMLGVTQEELTSYFGGRIVDIAHKEDMSDQEMLGKIKSWYNGYSWGGSIKVYNPFSLLKYLDSAKFQNYWFETGTPNFLMEIAKKNWMYDVSGEHASGTMLSDFNIASPELISLLFQTGYLTITHYDRDIDLYTLDYPNNEVRISYNQFLLNEFTSDQRKQSPIHVIYLMRALQAGDLKPVKELLNALFAGIPYDLWVADKEKFFHAIVHITFTLLGGYVQSEVHSSHGRCDAVVIFPEKIYVFEFKLDQSAGVALQQIRDKGYLEPHRNAGKTLTAVGVSFSSEKKCVEELEWVEV